MKSKRTTREKHVGYLDARTPNPENVRTLRLAWLDCNGGQLSLFADRHFSGVLQKAPRRCLPHSEYTAALTRLSRGRARLLKRQATSWR